MRAHIWTNAAYVLAGIYLATQGGFVPAVGLFVLGATSWIAHSKGGNYWYWDWAGMYMAFVTIIAHNLGYPWHSLLLFPAVFYATTRFKFDSILAVGALFCLALYLSPHPVYSLFIFAFALFVRQLTEDDDYPADYDRFHGGWHVLTAIGMCFLL